MSEMSSFFFKQIFVPVLVSFILLFFNVFSFLFFLAWVRIFSFISMESMGTEAGRRFKM